MPSGKIKIKRDVTKKECPWLDKDIPKGTEVFVYNGPTYGCVSSNGIAVTQHDGVDSFFEIPRDSI